ncbi:MAG: hypothetical protein NT000_08790 [Proteobacteria bacterium]|nr:hypothetical protein [Pseudomonadota bacterium]NQW44540.1 hypothetical protein [Deltaproteobacteria bacterium]
MKRSIIILLTVAASFYPIKTPASVGTLSQLAYQTINETWTRLGSVGLLEMNPWDTRLPRPQVPALKAVVNQRLRLLAYYNEENIGLGTTFVFNNPNGGQRHSVSFNTDWISFLTPYQGTVAHANRYMTVNGQGYNFYCQSTPVTEQGFYNCIDHLFISVIVNQLKQSAR